MLKKLNWQKAFVIFWFFVGPIPASLTLEDIPNMQRAIFMLPAWQIITAFGFYNLMIFGNQLSARFKLFKPAAILLIGTAFVYLLALFMHQLFYHQPRHQNWYRNGEWQSGVRLLETLDRSYNQVKISGTLAYYHLAFFSSYYRDFIIKHPDFTINRDYKDTWQIDKYFFMRDSCILQRDMEVETLYILGQNCPLPEWARIIGESKTSDGVTMLTFVDIPFTEQKLDELIKIGE